MNLHNAITEIGHEIDEVNLLKTMFESAKQVTFSEIKNGLFSIKEAQSENAEQLFKLSFSRASWASMSDKELGLFCEKVAIELAKYRSKLARKFRRKRKRYFCNK